MNYATPDRLLSLAGDVEALAQVAVTTDNTRISGALLRAVVEGGDTTDYSPAEIASGELAVARIEQALAAASRIVDSYAYLAGFFEQDIINSPIPDVTAVLALGWLYGERASEALNKKVVLHIAWLRDLAKGVVSIGSPTLIKTGQAHRLGGLRNDRWTYI